MNAQLRPVEIEPQVVPMTVEALRLLDDNGFFDGDCNKYELIDGVLVMTPPPGTGHFTSERRANMSLVKALLASSAAQSYAVQPGGALRIGDLTLLGPDLMIVLDKEGEIAAPDIALLAEISWSSRANDLGPKSHLYAKVGIADYWVLDVAAKSVIVHRDPVDGVYTSVQTFKAPAKIACLMVPDLSVGVADLF
jgi:Uma2 family endonuclease